MIESVTRTALFSRPPSEVDLKDLDNEIARMDGALTETREEVERLRAELDRLVTDRDALVSYRNFIAHFRGGPVAPTGPGPSGMAGDSGERAKAVPRGMKRRAILEILGDHVARSVGDIAEGLIARGIMTDSKAQTHSLQVTLSRMFRQGELARPSTGVYQLLPTDAPESTTGDENPFLPSTEDSDSSSMSLMQEEGGKP